MPLEMRTECENCHKKLAWNSIAFICSFECTWCEECTQDFQHTCPNCKGELVIRPKRKIKDTNEIE